MSIAALSYVWQNSKQSHGNLLVLLAIADYSKDDGSGAWPSIETLGKKARLSERQVLRCIKELVDAKELIVQSKAGPHGSNLYAVIMASTPDEFTYEPRKNWWKKNYTPTKSKAAKGTDDPRSYLKDYERWRRSPIA
jgi:hypothetical protein